MCPNQMNITDITMLQLTNSTQIVLDTYIESTIQYSIPTNFVYDPPCQN